MKAYNILLVFYNISIVLSYQIINNVKKYQKNIKINALKSNNPTNSLDFSSMLATALVNSPIYRPLVKFARNTMVETATKAGVDWINIYESIYNIKDWNKEIELVKSENPELIVPTYFNNKFHGYEFGNLCIDSAIEQELAGKAVGARNFPDDGIKGEEKLRKCYEESIIKLGGNIIPEDSIIVDFGCGTGTSTRRLAKFFPNAKKLIGFDLSPYMISIGRFLTKELKNYSNITWVDEIYSDDRIEYRYSDIAKTNLPDNSVSFVSICLVLHELPQANTIDILKEAYRILKPGGKLSILEMDPQSPGYVKLRQTPLLYSIIRSTEPYLDEYFGLFSSLPSILNEIGFPIVSYKEATGRHSTFISIKPGNIDYRLSDSERIKIDSHSQPLEK